MFVAILLFKCVYHHYYVTMSPLAFNSGILCRMYVVSIWTSLIDLFIPLTLGKVFFLSHTHKQVYIVVNIHSSQSNYGHGPSPYSLTFLGGDYHDDDNNNALSTIVVVIIIGPWVHSNVVHPTWHGNMLWMNEFVVCMNELCFANTTWRRALQTQMVGALTCLVFVRVWESEREKGRNREWE